MKDGRTHLAYKAEHAADLETGAGVGVTVQDAIAGDTATMVETLLTAAEQLEAVLPVGAGLTEVVGDKGYHLDALMPVLSRFWRPVSGSPARIPSSRSDPPSTGSPLPLHQLAPLPLHGGIPAIGCQERISNHD